jgi:hypothetical protein
MKELGCFENDIRGVLEEYNKSPEMTEERFQAMYKSARRGYLGAVCDSTWNCFAESPGADARFRLALMEPSISGLPAEFDVDYLCDNGISAGAVFAFAYYALTGKPISGAEMFRNMSMLNHLQNDMMNSVLDKLEKKG